MTLREFEDDATATQRFAAHVWLCVSFGEQMHLTRSEMADVLEDIAADIRVTTTDD